MNGAYAWDVPEGLWQVKYELDGYEIAYSDWLPVPPPQTEVNIGMISKAVPKLEWVNIYENYAEVSFDKYVMPNTINSDSLILKTGNTNIPYTLEYSTDEKDIKGNIFAKKYILRYSNDYKAVDNTEYTVSVNSNAKSYADISAIASNKNAKKKAETTIIAPDKHIVPYGGKSIITAKITPYVSVDQLIVECNSTFDNIVTVESISPINEDGTFTVELYGALLGTTDIIFSIKDTGIKATTTVTVSDTKETEVEISDYFLTKTGDVLNITANLKNNGNPTDAIVNVAVYNNEGRLLRYGFETVRLETGVVLPFEKNIDNVSNSNCTVKLFVWDNHQNLMPISNSYEQEIKSNNFVVEINNYNVTKTQSGFDITASFKNNSGTENGIVNIAVYNTNGRLLHYEYESLVLQSGVQNYNKSISYTPVWGQDYIVKLFIWNNHQGMTPISNFCEQILKSNIPTIEINDFTAIKNDNDFTVNASFKNDFDTEDGIVNIAIYNSEGKLLHYEYEGIAIQSGITPNYVKKLSYKPVSSHNYTIKIFIWKNHQNMVPISVFAEKTI